MSNETVLTRYEKNPIIVPSQVPNANTIFNSAVVPFRDQFAGVFRVDTIDGGCGLHVGFSKDALNWDIAPKPIEMANPYPVLGPQPNFGYDPRIAEIEGVYYITWCNEYHGPAIGLGKTTDFKNFEFVENVLPIYNRNAVLFPRKFDGQYLMFHRPSDPGHTPFGDIFICSSPDLVHWGHHRWVFGPRGGWQSKKVGAGPVPIETDEGWLLIYHGVKITCSGYIYSAGAALLDRDEPWKVLYRTRNYILAPTELYERVGDVPNVVFPVATLLDKPSGRLSIYYGCADNCVALAYAQIDELIEYTKKHSFDTN